MLAQRFRAHVSWSLGDQTVYCETGTSTTEFHKKKGLQMVSVLPVRKAFIPASSQAGQQLVAPNYDEFQSDHEIWDFIQEHPGCILNVTMPHCSVPSNDAILPDGSDAALHRAFENFQELRQSPLVQEVNNALFVYEIVSPRRSDVRQIGLLGMALTGEIRTEAAPHAPIIRNEGVREQKARGRADLIDRLQAIIGIVNNAVEDVEGTLTRALEAFADAHPPGVRITDEADAIHSLWSIPVEEQHSFIELLAAEPCAYVADGNHRSAAACMLGHESFLSAFFPLQRMRLAPYNRLIRSDRVLSQGLAESLREAFDVQVLGHRGEFQPAGIHEIGLYHCGTWYRLEPRATAFDSSNAAECIDADIVQRHILSGLLGIDDSRDARLTFVGGNKDSSYLKKMVDDGHFNYAVSLAPVTTKQFSEICRQNRFMPPKSTWFEPKVRSGLVIAMLQ